MKFKNLFLSAIVIVFSILLFLPFNIVQAKDLEYVATITPGEGYSNKFLRFRKYVRQYGSPSNSDWNYSDTRKLSSQTTNAYGSYVTTAIAFHQSYGTDYTSWKNDNTVIEVGYDTNSTKIDTSQSNLISEDDFFNKYGINTNKTWIKLGQGSNYGDGSWGHFYETGDAIIEYSKTSNKIAITDFRISGNTYNELIEKINTYGIQDGSYNKVLFSGKLSVRAAQTDGGTKYSDIYTAQQLIDMMAPQKNQAYYNGVGNTINSNWTGNDFGYNEKGPGRSLVRGYSVLNNFDNWLYIPSVDRDIYVTYKVKNSSNYLPTCQRTYQLLENGVSVNNLISSGNSEIINSETWYEKYTLDSTQKNLVLNYPGANVNFAGSNYTYAGMRVKTGTYDSGELGTSTTRQVVANDGGSDPIYVTFYYNGDTTVKEQKIYIKHVNINNGSSISALAGTEYFSDGFKENDLTSINKESYQTAYKFNADNIANGGVYKSNKFKNSSTAVISGSTYAYQGYKVSTEPTYSAANSSVSSTSMKSGDGHWINPSYSSQSTVIIFYYKPTSLPHPGGSTISDVKLVGSLDFINTGDYSSNTATTAVDNIPSSVSGSDREWLLPYVDDAYPYIVRAMKYSSTNKTSTVTPTITIKKKWYYTTTSTDSEGNVTVHVHRGTSSANHNYPISYNHIYYKIDNFKMYRISNLIVTDKKENRSGYGGYLFEGTKSSPSKDYTIGMSTNYENRFNNSRGVVGDTYSDLMTCTYTNKTYTLSGNASSSSEAYNIANSYNAAASVNLTVKWDYRNQYIELDGKTDMLNKNDKTYSYRVRNRNTTANITLDSTKNCNYTSNLRSYMDNIPSSKLTDYNDFNMSNKQTIGEEIDNGIRFLSGKLNYTLITGSKYNRGGNSFTSKDYTYEINGSSKNITSSNLGNIYKGFNESHKYYDNASTTEQSEVRRVNVFTPLKVNSNEALLGDSYKEVVDQTLGTTKKVVLQQGEPFTVTPSCTTGNGTYSLVNTDKFVDYYYVYCDFKTRDSSGDDHEANYSYRVNKGSSITLIPIDINEYSVTSLESNIYVVAVSKNATTNIVNWLENIWLDTNKIVVENLTYIENRDNNTLRPYNDFDIQSNEDMLTKKRYAASLHAVRKTISTKNISRMYDFEVTDCNDLAYKNVFKTNSGTNVANQNVYYSGKKYLHISNANNMNALLPRSPNSLTIPLGPYKNTDSTYIFAPKLGYRISYDLKTTGILNDSLKRYISIVPRYYYISKDGTSFRDNITLYFKGNNGKYQKITKYTKIDDDGNYQVSSGSGYNIYYKPNDGYRYLRGDVAGNYIIPAEMTSKLTGLKISSTISGEKNISAIGDDSIKLTNKMMTTNNEKFIQTWYGEFKLPNSTIAVDNNDTSSSVNNPLRDGYIGVIFDIYCIDVGGHILSYSKSNRNAGTSTNTSQWDYEGYLGFSTPGTEANVNIQLEKDVWHLNNLIYNKIKGTVLLYDIDARAADDYN